MVVVDVGKSMCGGSGLSRLEYAKAAVSMLVQGKVFNLKYFII